MPKDNSPVRHTCPMIDEVISAINSLVMPEDNWWTKEGVIEIMEKIRSANDQLRTWGNEMYNDKEYIEKTLNSEYIELENTNYYLHQEIESLKKDIEKLEAIAYPDRTY